MKIKVLIVEDNPLTSQDLKEIISLQGMEVTGIAKNRSEAVASIQEVVPDILLVDIFLKGGDNGIALIEELSEKHSFPFIYLTANSDRDTIDKALKTNPSSYLTKPFDERDLVIALELAFNNHYNKVLDSQTKETSFVFLKSGNRFEKVKVEDIQFLQAEGSYTKFITSQKEYTLSGNLNNTSEKVKNPSFIRIHRSYVVNIDNITGLDNDHIYINDKHLPIGRSYKEDVNKILNRIS
ncbi:LytR/AlgR family response regulator transcription factor [Ekhidna sp.]|uniref:LytR/AlgR family response regulator transcription factor n=1 Tax=Ekhidna sp. TaxID=2608089 RepID=UPI003CCB92F4